MNMRKKEYHPQKTKFNPSRPARIILLCGALLILLVLLGILHTVTAHAPLTKAAAVYYGGMLEYPFAALMITVSGAALADVAYKSEHR